MLIRVPQHSSRDLEVWERESRADPIVARSARHRARVERAQDALADFLAGGPCYVGVSWGKDSVCVAHLAITVAPDVPIVWVHRDPMDVPYCDLVEARFSACFPDAQIHTIRIRCVPGRREGADESWWAAKADDTPDYSDYPKQIGFRIAAQRFGPRYVSGVRADESSARRVSIRSRGLSTRNTCSPIAHWTGADVYAYLHSHGLPIHPSYAMTMGGLLSRDRIRVGSIGGPHGRGHGRAEWERHYYGWYLSQIMRERRG